MRSVIAMLPLLLLCACSHSRMMVTRIGPAGPEVTAVSPESVFVFTGEDRVLPKYRPIAHLSVEPGRWGTTLRDVASLEEGFRRESGKLGADAIILGELGGSAFQDLGGEGFWGTATAIRFLEPGPRQGKPAARGPRDLRTIAVVPIAAPKDLPVPDSIDAAFIQDISEKLRAAGFFLLPVEVFDSVWAAAEPKVEGVPDPVAALKDQDPVRSREHRTMRVLVEEHGVDGFVFPSIQHVEARFVGDKASWDGVSQKVGETRSIGARIVSGILNLIVNGDQDLTDNETTAEGSVWALSLAVQIENAFGARLYFGRGGIELLEEADFEGGIWIGDPEPEEYQVVEVPAEEIFTRRRRIDRAVRIALQPLLKAG